MSSAKLILVWTCGICPAHLHHLGLHGQEYRHFGHKITRVHCVYLKMDSCYISQNLSNSGTPVPTRVPLLLRLARTTQIFCFWVWV